MTTEMNQWCSPTLGKFAEAMAAAQGSFGKLIADKRVEMKGTTKTGKEYEVKYTYADLADALEACRACLNTNGIMITQSVATPAGRNGVEIVTTLVHSSGEWMRSAPLFMPVSGGAQDVGSAITYGRRYSLLAMVGLAPEDDDGAKAQSAAPKSWRAGEEPRPRQKPKPTGRTIEPEPDPDAHVSTPPKLVRDLDAAVKAYAVVLDEPPAKVWRAACKAAKTSASRPDELAPDAARAMLRLVCSRMMDTCTKAYAALDAAAPGDYPREGMIAEFCSIAGVDTWPEHPTHQQLADVHARLVEMLAEITDSDQTAENAP